MLLRKNPDFNTVWNFRRDILLHMFAAPAEAAGPSEPELCKGELALTQLVLSKKNPKSYGAWHHRRWVLSR